MNSKILDSRLQLRIDLFKGCKLESKARLKQTNLSYTEDPMNRILEVL